MTFLCSSAERVVTAIIQCGPSTRGALFEILSHNQLAFLHDPFALLLTVTELEFRQAAFRISGVQDSLSKLRNECGATDVRDIYKFLVQPSARVLVEIEDVASFLSSAHHVLSIVQETRKACVSSVESPSISMRRWQTA